MPATLRSDVLLFDDALGDDGNGLRCIRQRLRVLRHRRGDRAVVRVHTDTGENSIGLDSHRLLAGEAVHDAGIFEQLSDRLLRGVDAARSRGAEVANTGQWKGDVNSGALLENIFFRCNPGPN